MTKPQEKKLIKDVQELVKDMDEMNKNIRYIFSYLSDDPKTGRQGLYQRQEKILQELGKERQKQVEQDKEIIKLAEEVSAIKDEKKVEKLWSAGLGSVGGALVIGVKEAVMNIFK